MYHPCRIIQPSLILACSFIVTLALGQTKGKSTTVGIRWKQIDSLLQNQDRAPVILDSIRPMLPNNDTIYFEWIRRKVNIELERLPYIQVEPYFRDYLDVATRIKDTSGMVFGLARVGHIERIKRHYVKALELELQALALIRQHGRIAAKTVVGTYTSLAELHIDIDDLEKSMEYARTAWKVQQQELKNPPGQIHVLRLIGDVFRLQQQYDSAKYYYQEALKLKANRYTPMVLQGLGDLSFLQQAPEKAYQYYQQALDSFLRLNSPATRPTPHVELLLRLAKAQLALQKTNAADQTLTQAEALMQAFQLDRFITYQWYELRATCASQQGQFAQAAGYYRTYLQLYDSVTQERLSNRLLSYRTQFSLKEKEREIDYLNRSSVAREKERWFLLVGLMTLGLFTVGIFWLLHQRRKALRSLQLKHEQSERLLKEKTALLEELRQTQTHLLQSEKMATLGELTAGIAHELNNPINFISTNTYALQDDIHELIRQLSPVTISESAELTEEIESLLLGIRRGADRCTTIVNGLRLFARKSNDEWAPAEFTTGLDTCLVILAQKMEGKIQVNKRYESIPPVYCQFDKINQVFMNILSNAVDALLESNNPIKILAIDVWSAGHNACIRISDNGAGIPETIRSRIFEPFFTTKPAGKGTGLGLAISFGILQQHGGQLTVASTENEGSQFTITLPFNAPNQKSAT